MTKEKSNKTEGEKSPLSDFRSPIIFLGVLIAALAGIYWLFPQFWDTYWLTLLLIAAGLAIPFLFSPRKFWAGYGWQVGIAPGLAFVLMGVFVWFFGYRENALWEDAVRNLILTNSIILVVWLVLVMFAYGIQPHGRLWRDYGWILSPAVMVLIFLFSVSWAKSTLEINALEKSNSIELNVPNSNLKVRVVYPKQIIYGEQNTAVITLWLESDSPCGEKSISLSADHLFFALQPTDSSPLQWQQKITTKIPPAGNPLSIYIRPRSQDSDTTQEVGVKISVNNVELQDSASLIILLEGRGDAQSRLWKNSLLDASSISVVIGIVAAWIEIRRKEEEERRKRNEEIIASLDEFEQSVNSNFAATIEKWMDLTKHWEEWDQVFQDQARTTFSIFIENGLWDAIAGITLDEIIKDINRFAQVCERIFDDKEEKPISTLKQLQSALRLDEEARFNLLSMLKEYPASIVTAKIIARALPLDLKMKTIAEYVGKFPAQIRALRVELGFIDTESFPLQEQYSYYAKEHATEERLTAWLRAHELDCSPFADADSPFYSVPDKQLLITHATPGFALSTSDFQNITFEFANAWDAGAALFEFCITLPSNLRLKDDIFSLAVTPGMVEDYGADHPRKLLLHALAEQWIWLLAEEPTLFYSLESGQRDLAGRLLRWHDFSPSITVNKIAEFAIHLDGMKKERENEEKENQTAFFSKITEWLGGMSANELRTEEINALIGLRPAPTKRTLFLISAIDLNPHVTGQISPSLHEQLGAQSDWLSVHDCGLAHFLVDNKNPKTVSVPALVRQCNIRVQKCSRNKIEFNQLFDAPGEVPDAILAQKANGSPGRMVRLGQKLLMQHVERYPPDDKDNYKYLHIEDLIDLEL